jgi:hypothetical protein
MAMADLVKHGDGTQAGSVLQHRRDLAAQTAASGSGRRRPRATFFCEGSRVSCSNR